MFAIEIKYTQSANIIILIGWLSLIKWVLMLVEEKGILWSDEIPVHPKVWITNGIVKAIKVKNNIYYFSNKQN